MRTPSLSQLLVSALVLAVTLGTVSHAAARGASSSSATITGTVQTIDVGKRKITIKTDTGTSVKLAVGRSTAITRNGAQGSLADLTLSDSVTGQYKVSRLAATALTIRWLKSTSDEREHQDRTQWPDRSTAPDHDSRHTRRSRRDGD